MNLNIRITGPAWAWVNSTVDILCGLFSHMWYQFITDIEYESRIKWGVNYYDIHISDTNDLFLTKKVDILLALNGASLLHELPNVSTECIIIVNKKWVSKITNPDNYKILSLEIADKYDNTYLLAILAQYLSIDINEFEEKIKNVFKRKGDEVVAKNVAIIKDIYTSYSPDYTSEIQIKDLSTSQNYSYGNKALTYWAINSNLEYYSAYPMTPASTILSEVIQSGKVTYLQAEDEVSVINSALWASYTWARAMVWSSWGWFALMSEAISFAVQAEFPITLVLSQRAWPSTGTPTYHETGDINYALAPSFGDFEHVVLYPSNLEEAHYFGWLALNIADIYQIPVLILMDKQSSELYATHDKFTTADTNRGEIEENPASDYARYKLTESWISPRVKVGTPNGDFIATSYEHDEYGSTSEDSTMKVAMTEKRMKKLINFFKEQNIDGYHYFGNKNAKKIIITYSFTSYTAQSFISKNPEFGLMIITVLKPLNTKIRDFIKTIAPDELIFVENNYSWQMENYLSNNLWLKYMDNINISHMRKYDLMPFYIEDFNTLLNQ